MYPRQRISPHNTTQAQAIPTQGAQPCTLDTTYHHPASPSDTQPAPKVHASTPPTANSAAHATTTQTIPRRRHTTMHPRHDLPSPTTPKRYPTCIEGARHRTIDNEYHRQHHINTDHPVPRAHNRAPSTANTTANIAPTQADSRRRHTAMHPRHVLPPLSQPQRTPTRIEGALPHALGSR